MERTYRNGRGDKLFAAIFSQPSRLPLFYTYRGEELRGIREDRIRGTVTSADPVRGSVTAEITAAVDENLDLRLILTKYPAFGAVEWTVWFENNSDADSGVLGNVFSRVNFKGEDPVLRGILGDHQNQYRPYTRDLSAEDVHFRSDSGRATHVNFPYFDLEYGNGGVMLAIGWAGTWTADFEKNETGVTYTARSVNNLNTVLRPGEKIRTALFTFAYYGVRDEFYATNYWRSFFVSCNLPRADASGAPMTPFSTCCLAGDTGFPNSDGSISERSTTWRPSLEKMIGEGVKVDFRWFDAGWYVTPARESAQPYVAGHDWWDTVGTWEPDPAKWPGGSFRESTDFAREHGMKTLVWFEPERVTDPDSLVTNFGYRKEWAICPPVPAGKRQTVSNNIGDPACRAWTTERICRMLRENRVEMYREDNNCDPAPLWAYLDGIEGENRSGITECKLIDGHYRMWDDIIACTLSYGGCGFVDSCASGGGRNDLESLRRGVPLLRSDSDRTTTALRLSMSSSFNRWIPFCGAHTSEKQKELADNGENSAYTFRASYLPALNVSSRFVYKDDGDFSVLREGLREWKSVRRYLLCEFYPLTPWHTKNETDSFTAHIYFDPADDTGILLAFRQETCPEGSLALRLPEAMLPAGTAVVLTDEDSGEKLRAVVGEEFTLTFPSPRSSHLYRFRRA